MLKKLTLIIFTIFVTNLICFGYEPFLPKGTLVKVYVKKGSLPPRYRNSSQFPIIDSHCFSKRAFSCDIF